MVTPMHFYDGGWKPTLWKTTDSHVHSVVKITTSPIRHLTDSTRKNYVFFRNERLKPKANPSFVGRNTEKCAINSI